jgi:hypothetical protein
MTTSFDLFYQVIFRSIYVKSTKYIKIYSKCMNDYNTEENRDLVLILHHQCLQISGWIGATVVCCWGHITLQESFYKTFFQHSSFFQHTQKLKIYIQVTCQCPKFPTPNHRFSVWAPYVNWHIILILYKNCYCCILSPFL